MTRTVGKEVSESVNECGVVRSTDASHCEKGVIIGKSGVEDAESETVLEDDRESEDEVQAEVGTGKEGGDSESETEYAEVWVEAEWNRE